MLNYVRCDNHGRVIVIGLEVHCVLKIVMQFLKEYFQILVATVFNSICGVVSGGIKKKSKW